ncbi:tRNA_pseudouridine32 synthase [Hexamita inflata]|uniref:tRNA pseudouridine32 synthase n=1 Tax=Hexamita inflata TaxID=28002 RepID=A0AA86Q3P0_9EUKA|nr:tRNA pseudouridine32 synthase [Hexamita inflata]
MQIIESKPYNYVYLTFAKQRWLGKKYIDILSIEFKDFNRAYFEQAFITGQVQILRQDKFLYHDSLIAKDSDIIIHFTHRHEAPIFDLPKVCKTQITIPNTDQQIDVCYKPSGMPVHPASHYNKHSLINLVKFQSCNRLDRLVSGYLLGSSDIKQLPVISKLIQDRDVLKLYVADIMNENALSGFYLVYAPIAENAQTEEEAVQRTTSLDSIPAVYGQIDSIGYLKLSSHDEFDLIYQQLKNGQQVGNVQHAISLIQIENEKAFCYPLTGRTHQLRIHLKFLNCSIIDDPLYGGKFEIIQQELVGIQHSEVEDKIDKYVLKQQLIKSLKELKAMRFKNIDEICKDLELNDGFHCVTCQMLEEEDKCKEEEKLTVDSKGIIKINNPWKYSQKYLRLHNFYYGIKNNGEFVGQQPAWNDSCNYSDSIANFKRIVWGSE